MSYKTVSIKEEVYDLVKLKARQNLRGISNQIEFDVKEQHNQSNFSSDRNVFLLDGELGS